MELLGSEGPLGFAMGALGVVSAGGLGVGSLGGLG